MKGFQNGLENLYKPILSSAKRFTDDLQIVHAPNLKKPYEQYQNIVPEYENTYINESKYNYAQDTGETNILLRQILSAIREGKVITIGESDVGKASVNYIQREEGRLQKSIVGTY